MYPAASLQIAAQSKSERMHSAIAAMFGSRKQAVAQL
jgi:hypothetical protein